MEIEYDPIKAISNLQKHRVSFAEAATALLDEQALAYEDGQAEGEPRWKLLGMSAQGRLLVVIYTVRGESLRLISARKATMKEVKGYAQ
jgi:uncharacterized DUF497 family protein